MRADLVAVEDEHVGSRSRELARDREPGEARAADDDVGVLVDELLLGAPAHRELTATRARSTMRGLLARPSTS